VCIPCCIKSPGISVKKGDALIAVETDKVNVDVPVPEYGRLIQVSAREGDLVRFGAVTAVIAK
jgi:2-oxoglutarate dehydrogenase E2 component (dihydrolipoamide succinyltransferase)